MSGIPSNIPGWEITSTTVPEQRRGSLDTMLIYGDDLLVWDPERTNLLPDLRNLELRSNPHRTPQAENGPTFLGVRLETSPLH